MVDASSKQPSKRTARSQVKVELGEELFHLIQTNKIEKGDILTTAKIAGIQAAKRTSELIPLCHQLNLAKVDVQIELNDADHSARIISTVSLTDRTGAEMESLVCSAIWYCFNFRFLAFNELYQFKGLKEFFTDHFHLQ